MSAMLDYMQLCRLCLVKEKVNVPIFGDENDVRQIFLKITACLPVKVAQEDNLPKKICDACLYKVDLLYQFWNTTVNAEKQLIQWLTEIGVDVNIKNSDSQTLPILPQSHAHPHSIPVPVPVVTIPDLKQERPDIVEKPPDFQIPEQPNMYSGYDNLGYPQAEVTMEVGAANTFVQPEPAEEPPPPEPPAPTPKKRGRPAGATNKKSPPKKKPTPAPPVVVSPRTNSTRRSSATAAAAAVAAAAAAATDSEEDSDGDDRLGGMDYDDSDSDEDHITKEEADSDEDYEVKPKSFLGVPSSADGEQPGPSGLGGVKGETSGANATESGRTYSSKAATKSDPSYVVVGYVPLDSLSNMGLLSGGKSAPPFLILNEDKNLKKSNIPSTVPIANTSVKYFPTVDAKNVGSVNSYTSEKNPLTVQMNIKENLNIKNYININTNLQTNIVNFTNKVQNQEKKKFKCTICPKKYSTEENLECHLYYHKTFIRPKCNICLKTFHSKSALKGHQLLYPKEKDFVCSKCNKIFHSKEYYDIHVFIENQNVFNCYECKEPFDDFNSVKEHVREIHKKTAAQQCDLCGKTYHNFSTLKKHIKFIHMGMDYCKICEICGKALSSAQSLEEHMLLHNGIKPSTCEYCGRTFAKRHTLIVHLRTHSGIKPYKCNHCGKSFSQSSSLKIHVRNHTGEKPYDCKLCNKKFISRGVLNAHKKSKHKLL